MNRISWIFFIIFLISPLYAPPDWKSDKFLDLNKDEFYIVTFQADEVRKTLYFRWTLLKNNGLVMHLNYDYFPHQFILYRDYQRNCYKVPLFKEDQKNYNEGPFFMLCFKDYNRKTKIATLKYYIYDGKRDFKVIDERKDKNGGFGSN